jgi:hypothetical protein
MPTCAQARPGSCPCCGAPSSPLGERLIIVGHGLVERQVQGPATADGAPEQGVVTLRRYRCRRCDAVLIVGPRGLVVRRSPSRSPSSRAAGPRPTRVPGRALDAPWEAPPSTAGSPWCAGSTRSARCASSPWPDSTGSGGETSPATSFSRSRPVEVTPSVAISPRVPSLEHVRRRDPRPRSGLTPAHSVRRRRRPPRRRARSLKIH